MEINKDLEFKQIVHLDEKNLDIMTKWMYDWWGKEDNLDFDGTKCFVKHSFQKDKLPCTYGLFLNGTIIAMFQFTYEDLYVRPDIYPWLCNVYVDENYRNKGIARILLKDIKEIARSIVPFDEIYLYTKHIGLYEKFGFEYVSEIDTHTNTPRIQRLYKLNIRK